MSIIQESHYPGRTASAGRPSASLSGPESDPEGVVFEGRPIASVPGGRSGPDARVWDVRGSFDAETVLASHPTVPDVALAAGELLRKMVMIRRFEETALDLAKQGRIIGAVHSSIGQEATAVGICSALETTDVVAGTHRSHGHALAKGSSPRAMMAELFGKVTGVNRGRGGSMHVADAPVGFLGASGIVGGGLPLAVGAALASRLRGRNQVSVAFFGDGAANQGVVHESMNLAAVWRASTIFVCENNGYAVSTPAADAVAGAHIAFRALAYGLDGCIANGQDVLEVLAVAMATARRVRAQHVPFLIEAKTYRFREHAEGISLKYRPDSEIEEWMTLRDPIQMFTGQMYALGILSPVDVDRVEEEIRDVMSEAVSFAESSPAPDPTELYEYLYA
jgi:TPP-dependent pyruvate/acetoin dehydrogenase alpha subunit